jgi:hypothetical protein
MNNNIVLIDLDKKRSVRLGNKALKMIEKTLNTTVNKLLTHIEEISVEDMTIIIYEGLKHEDKDITLSQVEDLLDEHSNYGLTLKTIVGAIKSALGADVRENNGNDNPNG